MKKNAVGFLSIAVMLASISALQAETKFSGGPGDTPVTLEQFGDAPGSSVDPAGGNPDGVLTLTQAIDGQNNFATFDLSDAGPYGSSVFVFDFLIDPTDNGPSADGISFSYADTATYGASGGLGAAPFTPEDPAAAGVLGFGFDTWSNQGAFDDPNVPTGSDYQEISVFWDGNLIDRIDDTRLLDPPLTLDDGQWHQVVGTVDFAGGNVSLVVDGNSIHSGLAVPGLAPFESRIMFAARTGGENELALVDNLVVNWIPEPSSALMGLILATGFGALWRRRRD